MKKTLVALVLLTAACATVPYTNRKQVNFISRAQESQLGEQAYAEVAQKEKPSKNAKYQSMVDEVGVRIAQAADEKEFKWEFKVFESEQVNAFCLPGGKVAFYEGIMPVCGDETGVAVVMGHEVAHALASHGAERMTQGLGTEIVGTLLAVGLAKTEPATQQRTMQLFGLGAQVGFILPWGRKQESEADKIGLILMAKAGYDPRAAIAFWERMDAKAGGGRPPEFLSTHPSGETRIAQIKAWLPEVMQHYRPKN